MLRPAIPVRVATADDRALVANVLAAAFMADPALGYIFPDIAARPRKLLQFFALIARTEADPADTLIAGGDAAATVWRKPGHWATPTSVMLRHAWPMLTTFRWALPRALRLSAALEKHHPLEPHWYLEFAGTDPARHGRGFGGAAIRARLRECDAQGIPAALETANEANLAIYAALGFRVTGTFEIGDSLTFWTMWRDPVAATELPR